MSAATEPIRRLYYGDNLPILRSMEDESVDLIYLDPPFNSNRAYNVIYPDDMGQVQAFDDTWAWTPDCDKLLSRIDVPMLRSLIDGLGQTQMAAYLVNMTPRLVELHRVLKPTGSIYLHCDPTASHYLKVIMDAIFGLENFRNEIVWRIGWVSGFKTQKRGWIRNHDTLLYYLKTTKAARLFNKEYIPYRADYVRRDGKKPTGKGIPIEDTWNCHSGDTLDSIMIKSFSKEKMGYATQKPVDLLKRIIKASSNRGDVVLDPFCGCGTTVHAAEQLGRQWIGIDLTYAAISVMREGFTRKWKGTIAEKGIWNKIEVLNVPKTVEEVTTRMAQPTNPRKEFEKFCVGTIGGKPNETMGADGGVDGHVSLLEGKHAIVSVKSGHVDVRMVRELNGLLNDKAVAGVFVTKEPPTKPMRDFVAQAGICELESEGLFSIDPFPRLQILTLEEILRGRLPELPYVT